MNRIIHILLLAALAAIPLSGCLGLPEGSADSGYEVALQFRAFDADSGETLVSSATGFVIGSGDSGLGPQFERNIIGHKVNETFTFVINNEGPTRYPGEASVPRALSDVPLVQQTSHSTFISFVGLQPDVGLVFPLAQDEHGNVLLEGRVLANDTQVSFRVLVEDGQEIPAPEIGAKVRYGVIGDNATRSLVSDVGAVFGIAVPAPGRPTLLGLQPGAYRSTGMSDTDLLFEFNSNYHYPQLLGRNVRYEVTLLGVAAGDEELDPDRRITERTSPVLRGTPDDVRKSVTPSGDDHHDDGHGDHGH